MTASLSSQPPTAAQSDAADSSEASSPRVSAMDGSPKGRILAAAAHLFRARGFDKTTVRELAAAVGIQSGSLFHHFKSKDEILEAVMVEVIEFNTGRLLAALEREADPQRRLRALILVELQSITGDTREAMSLLVSEWRALDEQAQARVLLLRDRYEQLFLDAIEAAAGELVDVDPFIMRRFIYGIQSVTRYWFSPTGELSPEQLVDEMMKLFRNKEQP